MKDREPEDRGSVLALVPAGFLVLIILAALAVDSSVVYQSQQQLHDTLVAAANDAASAAVDRSSFYQSGKVALSVPAAERVVCQSVSAQHSSRLRSIKLLLGVHGPAIRVEAEATVDAVFGRAIPGFGSRRVRAAVDAVAATGAASGWQSGDTPWSMMQLRCS